MSHSLLFSLLLLAALAIILCAITTVSAKLTGEDDNNDIAQADTGLHDAEAVRDGVVHDGEPDAHDEKAHEQFEQALLEGNLSSADDADLNVSHDKDANQGFDAELARDNNNNNNNGSMRVSANITAEEKASAKRFVLDKPQGKRPSFANNTNNNDVPPPPPSVGEQQQQQDGGDQEQYSRSGFDITALLFAPSVGELSKVIESQQQQDLDARAGEPTVCPPGSTADGHWGLSEPRYNSLDFYSEKSKHSRTFGRWITGKRSEVLEAVCRERKVEDCEWDKPALWAPFRGGRRFSLNTTATFYYRDAKLQHGQDHQDLPAAALDAIEISQPKSGVFPVEKRIPTLTTTLPPRSEQRHKRAKAPPALESELNFCYDFQDPIACLRGKTVLFIGDSHMLNLAQALCRMILKKYPASERGQFQSICGPLDVRFTTPMTVVKISSAGTTIAMLRVRYNLEVQMRRRFDTHPHAAFLEQTASFVLYNRAMWDLVYKDTDRKVVAAETTNSLLYLARRFQKARILFKMLQYDHKFMRGCSDPERMRQVRDANTCSVFMAMEENAQLARMRLGPALQKVYSTTAANLPVVPFYGVADPHWKFAILDSFGMTRELPYEEATDGLGHHYESAVVESLAQQMLSVFCPSQPQNHTLMFERFRRVAQTSCARLLQNTSQLRKPRCACNTEFSWRSTRESRELCEGVAKSGNWVAYLVNG